MNILIERLAPDRLSQKTWRFYVSTAHGLDGVSIRLTSYHELARPTARHKLNAHKRWLYQGGNDCWSGETLKAPPEVLPSVRAEVLRRVTESITFVEPEV